MDSGTETEREQVGKESRSPGGGVSEMVEKVARALCEQHNARYAHMIEREAWGETSDYAKARWREAARAAIEALREPTEAMIEAVDDDELIAWECFRGNGDQWTVADVYRAMVSAALERVS